MSKLTELTNITLTKTFEALERGTMPKPKLRLLKSEALHKATERWFPRVARLEDLIQEVAAGVYLCHGCLELLPQGEKRCAPCDVEMMGDAGPLDIA